MASDQAKNRMHVFKNTGKDVDVSYRYPQSGETSPEMPDKRIRSIPNRTLFFFAGNAQAEKRSDSRTKKK